MINAPTGEVNHYFKCPVIRRNQVDHFELARSPSIRRKTLNSAAAERGTSTLEQVG